jgi:hypothetical protein
MGILYRVPSLLVIRSDKVKKEGETRTYQECHTHVVAERDY